MTLTSANLWALTRSCTTLGTTGINKFYLTPHNVDHDVGKYRENQIRVGCESVYLLHNPAVPPRGLLDQIPDRPVSFTWNHHCGVPESHSDFHYQLLVRMFLDRSSEINPSFGRPSTRSCSLLERKEAPVRRNWCNRCLRSG